MARPKTYEETLLRGCRMLLDEYSTSHEQQLFVLEALSSLCGGFCFGEYCALFDRDCSEVDERIELAKELKRQLDCIGIPYSLGVSILAREPLSVSEQKKLGAFYTDFRLSQLVGGQIEDLITVNADVADISAGTGILLSGLCECYARKFSRRISIWVATHVYAYDLSPSAIRGTIAALSCYLSRISDVRTLASHCFVQDSLLTKKPSFDIIVGNPPWGKIKLTRYAFSLQDNTRQVYGGEYSELDKEKYEATRGRISEYAKVIKEKFDLIGSSEPDMYMAFLQEGLNSLKKNGAIAILIPAGFIRSQGMERFRRKLFNDLRSTSIVLLNNKARFFSIDTRFKFLLLSGVLSDKKSGEWSVSYSRADVSGRDIRRSVPVSYSAKELQRIRKDLSIPECSTAAEKQLFAKVCSNGVCMSEFVGKAKMTRELDMTLDHDKFSRKGVGCAPVVEGRMVQAFRFGAKAYVSGEGRKAKWVPTCGRVKPQFFVQRGLLSDKLMSRTNSPRAGFCDIAGQTNERAMMSAVIPKGVVCGNKVPTLCFGDKGGANRLLFWVGVTNSFVFDWMLRRVLTTTVNMFLLNGLPFPRISLNSKLAREIVAATRELSSLKREFYEDNARMSRLRATIDAAVLQAYGLDEKDLRLIMDDFPLLDRKQTPIAKERKSTITRDMVFSLVCEGEEKRVFRKRVEEARRLGAKAYIPYEMRSLTKGGAR